MSTAQTRLIPAHAGKTRRPRRDRVDPQAHPRSRGENTTVAILNDPERGSSPLTRGKLLIAVVRKALRGLIPAHAGKTCQTPETTAEMPAHPRSRGENGVLLCGLTRWGGSSPLTRGKPCPRTWPRSRYRLIPAHAGKTEKGPCRLAQVRAHPRSRGENRFPPRDWAHADGSSPLTRGKRPRRAAVSETARLIPAHAGKTENRGDELYPVEAHPRSRGENPNRSRPPPTCSGSSPLTRGKHFLTCAFIAQIGQILESLELCASSETYSLKHVSATDSPQDQVRSIGLDLLSSRGASLA